MPLAHYRFDRLLDALESKAQRLAESGESEQAAALRRVVVVGRILRLTPRTIDQSGDPLPDPLSGNPSRILVPPGAAWRYFDGGSST